MGISDARASADMSSEAEREELCLATRTSVLGFGPSANRARMLNREEREMQREATSPSNRKERDREKICPTAISDAWESAVEC